MFMSLMSKKGLAKISIFVAWSSLFSLNLLAGGDMTISNFERDLSRSGVDVACPVSEMEAYIRCATALNRYVEIQLYQYESLAKTERDEELLGNLETAIDLLNFAAKEAGRLVEKGSRWTPLERASIYVTTLRIVYSARSVSRVGLRNENMVMKVPRLATRGFTRAPFTPPKALNSPIGLHRAKKESHFLVESNSAERFVSLTSLASMTTLQIASLDVSESHPNWYSRKTMSQKTNSWADLENWVNTGVTARLQKEGIVNTDAGYDLNQARRVLIISEIKSSATSPKISARDIYGLKWKVKWGNEVQSEPIANRLFVKLGAKNADLVYANEPGVKGLVLVLASPDEPHQDSENDCERIVSVDQLKQCLLSSSYNFNIQPYILTSGTLNRGNEDIVLEQMEPGLRNKLRGRQYLTFRESGVEFSGSKVMKRGGPAAGSLVGADRDRVGRGLLLFNSWIKNIDAKDENNRGAILKDFNGKKAVYVETQHDLGASLGVSKGIEYFPAMINALETDFLEVQSENEFGWADPNQFVKISGQLLYKPRAWERSTHADLLWMARQISQLSIKDIEEAVRSNQWPDFMVEAMTYRLVARRNQIAKVYGTAVIDGSSWKAPSRFVDLTTPQKRSAVAARYGLSQTLLDQALNRARLLDAAGMSTYVDVPARSGTVTPCNSSLLVNLLEATVNPSGLSRRATRTRDDIPLAYCSWKP
jgi:hypothetical protein